MLRHPRWQARRARYRVIQRRARFWRNIEGWNGREVWNADRPGRWAKFNGCCSCGMCRSEKYRDRRATERARAARDVTRAYG